jgi:hypothetical protein
MYTLVIVESPYAPKAKKPEGKCSCDSVAYGDQLCGYCELNGIWQEELFRNLDYARAAMKDCLLRGEAPYASHLLYTQPGVLDDTIPEEREHGIQAGFAWRQVAAKTVVYTDLGISRGMEYGMLDASKRGSPIEMRSLPGWK